MERFVDDSLLCASVFGRLEHKKIAAGAILATAPGRRTLPWRDVSKANKRATRSQLAV